MCVKWLVYCACCNKYIYMHAFKHCGEEKCKVVGNLVLPQSYCDLCIENGCRSTNKKCNQKELKRRFTTMKLASEYNYNIGINKKRYIEE